jgi:hypothetical protein
MALIGSLGKQTLTGNSQNESVAATRPGTKRTSVSAAGPSGYVESNATVSVVFSNPLVISLEGCCDPNDFKARLTKSARFRGFEPKPIIRPVRRPEPAPERREAAP